MDLNGEMVNRAAAVTEGLGAGPAADSRTRLDAALRFTEDLVHEAQRLGKPCLGVGIEGVWVVADSHAASIPTRTSL